MSLEDLLKPVKIVKGYTFDIADEWILRQYTKATQWWEKKGHDKYSLCTGIILASAGYFALRNVADPKTMIEYMKENPVPQNKTAYALAYSYYGLLYHDLLYTLNCELNSSIKSLASERTMDRFEYVSQKVQRAVRLPTLILGASGFYDFAVALKHNFSWQDFAHNSASVIMGGLIMALASSMYIKDTNPKSLQNEPFWKRAYATLRDKITTPSPHPIPTLEPAPCERYQHLS